MSKGTSAQGKKSSGKSHITCRRCGKKSFNVKKGYCASCGFGRSAKMKDYNWAKDH
ncbi:MAG: 50S ribosomal protein L37e [Candidatus Thermoplasmatota archaeon]|nr:50S ribosomal protein L37e [Candidatus Thermoplasmatota archaeon]